MAVKRARFGKRVAKLLTFERVSRVATVNADGTPHLVPVCHVLAGGRLYFASGDDARKVRNIEANARVTVTVDLYSEDWAQLYDGSPSFLSALGKKEGEPVSKAARLQFAWHLYWDLGIKMIGVDVARCNDFNERKFLRCDDALRHAHIAQLRARVDRVAHHQLRQDAQLRVRRRGHGRCHVRRPAVRRDEI